MNQANQGENSFLEIFNYEFPFMNFHLCISIYELPFITSIYELPFMNLHL